MRGWFEQQRESSSTCPECRAPLMVRQVGLIKRMLQCVHRRLFYRDLLLRLLISSVASLLMTIVFALLAMIHWQSPDHKTIAVGLFAVLTRFHVAAWALFHLIAPR